MNGTDGVEDVTFYMDTGRSRSAVPAETVREAYYGHLDEELREHEPVYESRQVTMGDRDLNSKKQRREQEAAETYEDWMDDVLSTPVTAEIDHGTTTSRYSVWPRAEIDFLNHTTAPCVMFLYGEDVSDPRQTDETPAYVLREWRNYDEQVLTDLHNCDVPFDRGKHDDYLFQQLGTDRFDPDIRAEGDHYTGSLFSGDLLLVTENLLEAALHREGGVYDRLREMDAGAPVTPPNVTVAGIGDSGSVYALRDWRPSAFRRSFDSMPDRSAAKVADLWGTHYGTRQGLGFLWCMDTLSPDSLRSGAEVEYLWDVGPDGPVIVNGDPEYVAVTENDRWHRGTDWRQFRREELERGGRAPQAFVNRVKDRKDAVAEVVGDEIDLLEHVPRHVDADLFSDEKRIRSL